MFTGLLPSEHGAHFQNMAYGHASPTIAEVLGQAGYRTKMITRNFVFDGAIPGINRGFQEITRPIAEVDGSAFAVFLALAKPRIARHLRETGFFRSPVARTSRFVRDFARSLLPADRLALEEVKSSLVEYRRRGDPYFIFCNLYDVHAPYAPADDSLLESTNLPGLVAESAEVGFALAALGRHKYLEEGFHLPARLQRRLLWRYHRAIELMDAKLAAFFREIEKTGVLQDTLVILTSDHGEAFGEHGLYLHDASVFQTHLHVPLWILAPGEIARYVDDVVSTRDLYDTIRRMALRGTRRDTLLDASARRPNRVIAEHFFYPHASNSSVEFKKNLCAVVGSDHKTVSIGGSRYVNYDLRSDPSEDKAEATDSSTLDTMASSLEPSARDAYEHLLEWGHSGTGDA